MKSFFAALRFLTILPVPGDGSRDGIVLENSLVYFPVVGLLLGLLSALAAVGLQFLLPPLPVAVVLVSLLVLFSGGLHMDGLADTADGFFSSRPRERILEIMRDSAIGSMGTLAMVLVLCLKIATLASVPGSKVWQAVFLMPLAGRSALVLMTSFFPYARYEGGLASPFFKGGKAMPAGVALLLFMVCALVVAGAALGGLSIMASGAVCLLFGSFCMRKIGGITGDTLGCTCELVETAIALIFAVH
ncbi:MAG: adenosylcobinamide-GDP ribazoletransferase [Deltaproteobacteria bacterium]